MKQVRRIRYPDLPDQRWDVLHEEADGYIGQRNLYGTGPVRRFLHKDDYELVPEPVREVSLLERVIIVLVFLVCGLAAGVMIYLWGWADCHKEDLYALSPLRRISFV